MNMNQEHSRVRPAAVAGSFYPAAADVLGRQVAEMMARASATSTPRDALPAPKMLIVPHAGYVYSGATAAQGYALLASTASRIRRVVMIGPAHRVAVTGLAVVGVDAFWTPLGPVPVDRVAIEALRAACPNLEVNDQAHAWEHSLEVQLPFLQTVLERFSIVPMVFGRATAQEVGCAIETLWGQEETLIVISSDLSHYHEDALARALDRRTVERILALEPTIRPDQACGSTAIDAAILCAVRHGLEPRLVAQTNSAAANGDPKRVVGYASIAFEPRVDASRAVAVADASQQDAAAPRSPGARLGTALLARARNAIATRFGRPARPEPADDRLSQPGAAFVTLTLDGRLRGCIGSLVPQRSLETEIREQALAAAFRDPRFPPLTADEFDRVEIEVSLIGPMQAIIAADEESAMRVVEPHADGLVLRSGQRQATFLPQVWQQLPRRADFLSALKAKAGLDPKAPAPELSLWRYQVTKWCEADGPAPSQPGRS